MCLQDSWYSYGPKTNTWKAILESCYIFKHLINSVGHTPSVEELCSLITPDLSGDDFIRTFMLLALSAFLCPNTRSGCSSWYYPPLVNVNEIAEFNWCSFVLQWFVSYVAKYKKRKLKSSAAPCGGCCVTPQKEKITKTSGELPHFSTK